MASLGYLAKGWSVIPVKLIPGKDGRIKKQPLVSWKRYQKELPTEADVRTWWGKEYPDASIGLVCGQVSGGIYVLDIDPRNGGDRSLDGKSLPAGPHSRTPHGGQHHFFRSNVALAKRQVLPGVDFQGEGSIAILSPTPGYTWLEEPGVEWPELPKWVTDLVPVADRRKKSQRCPHIDIPLEQQMRFIPEYNGAVIKKAGRKKIDIWVHQAWTELRTLSIQVDGGSGFLDFQSVIDFLIRQGFRSSRDFHQGPYDCLAWHIIDRGMDNHWERTPGGKLSLLSAVKVGQWLEVNDLKTRRWHVLPVPLSELTDKREKLAYFRTIANYNSIDRRNDPKHDYPIWRKTVQHLSGVSPSTQLADDKVLGLLNGKRRKMGGKAQYRPRAEEEETGPPYRQISSKHWSPARWGPHDRLRIIRKALEGRRSDTAYPPRYFDDDAHYQKAIERGPVADDPLVILPQVERRNYYPPVRPTVELWREPVSV